MNRNVYSSTTYRKWALMLMACHFLLSSITLRNSKKYKIFAVEAADGSRRQHRQRRSDGNSNDNRQKRSRQRTDQNQNNDPSDPSGYYQALNVDKKSDTKKIKSAYRKLALKYHVGIFLKLFFTCENLYLLSLSFLMLVGIPSIHLFRNF